MEEMAVALTKNGRRKWTPEQRLHIVNEYNSGVNSAEICRKYNIHAQVLYRWKKLLESTGKGRNNAEIVARGQYLEALRKIEELEKVLGRKTLELDILKKSYELKGLKLPEGI